MLQAETLKHHLAMHQVKSKEAICCLCSVASLQLFVVVISGCLSGIVAT